MLDEAPEQQAREFAAAFRRFLDWIHTIAVSEDNEVSALVRDYVGPDGAQHSVVTRELPPFEHVNLQTAVNAWSGQAGRPWKFAAWPCRRTTAACRCSSWSRASRCRRCG